MNVNDVLGGRCKLCLGCVSPAVASNVLSTHFDSGNLAELFSSRATGELRSDLTAYLYRQNFLAAP